MKCFFLHRSKKSNVIKNPSLLVVSIIFVSICSAQSTVDGYIVSNTNDTIHSTFITAKKKKFDNWNNFNYVKVLIKDSSVSLAPNDILSYKKGSSIFKAFRKSSDTSFFAKLITSGRVHLYYSNHEGGKYYFKKIGENYYYEIDYKSESIVLSKEDYKDQASNYQRVINQQIPDIKSNEEEFKNFFMNYFHDNISVVNKLKHEFYRFSSIEYMFKEYNKVNLKK